MNRKVCFFIFVLMFAGFPQPAGRADTSIVQTGRAGPDANLKESQLNYSLSDFINAIRAKNTDVLTAQLDLRVAAQKVKSEKSIFEPMLVHTYQYQDAEYPLSTEKANDILGGLVSQPDPDKKYTAKQGNLGITLKQLLPTGGELELNSSWQDLTNDAIQQSYKNHKHAHEHSSDMGLQFRQPLLKNAGTKITTAGIHLAEKDEKISEEELAQKWMKTVYTGIGAYWDLYLARKNRDIAAQSVSQVERVLEDNKQRVRAGKMAETELKEAGSGLLLRKIMQKKALQKALDAETRARALISSRADLRPGLINPVEKPFHKEKKFDFEALITGALENRPVYQKLKHQAEQADIRIMVAKNGRWPQLDLTASYKKNGLGLSPHDSLDQMLDDNYNTWAVGIELQLPLAGGMKSKSELAAAQYRKRQILLALHYAETSLANGIHDALENVSNQWSTVQMREENLAIKEDLLKTEMLRLDTGHSTTRRVLEREEDVTRAKSDAVAGLVDYQKSLAQLSWISGMLIKKYPLKAKDIAKQADRQDR